MDSNLEGRLAPPGEDGLVQPAADAVDVRERRKVLAAITAQMQATMMVSEKNIECIFIAATERIYQQLLALRRDTYEFRFRKDAPGTTGYGEPYAVYYGVRKSDYWMDLKIEDQHYGVSTTMNGPEFLLAFSSFTPSHHQIFDARRMQKKEKSLQFPIFAAILNLFFPNLRTARRKEREMFCHLSDVEQRRARNITYNITFEHLPASEDGDSQKVLLMDLLTRVYNDVVAKRADLRKEQERLIYAKLDALSIARKQNNSLLTKLTDQLPPPES